MPPFKKYEEIASREELKKLYKLACKEAEEFRSSRSHERILLKQMSAEQRGLKQDLKKEQSKLLVLSKEKKSADEQKKSAGWNGAAVVSVALLYQAYGLVRSKCHIGGSFVSGLENCRISRWLSMG